MFRLARLARDTVFTSTSPETHREAGREEVGWRVGVAAGAAARDGARGREWAALEVGEADSAIGL